MKKTTKNNNTDEGKGKEKKPSGFFSLLKEFIIPYRVEYILSVIVSCFGVFCNLGSYAIAGVIAGKLWNKDQVFADYLTLIIVMIILKVMYGILINTSTWISHRAAFKTLRDIRMGLVNKMIHLPLGFFELNGSGRLKTLIVDRVESIEKTLAHLLPEMTANILIPFVMLIWAYFIDWRIGLIITAWVLLGLAFSSGMMSGYEQKFADYTKAERNMNQAIVEYVDGIEVIKNYNRTEDGFKKLVTNVKGHAAYAFKWQKDTEVFMAMIQAIAPFSVFPVTIAGLIFVHGGSLDVSSLLLLILLSLGIYGPLYKAVNYTDQVASMGSVAQEIREVLDSKELIRGSYTTNNDKISIEFKNVYFAYNKEEKNTLSNVSFKIEPGTMFALVGASGSGKSTIAKLIAGYWDKNRGDIFIGDKTIEQWSQSALNKMISYVDQDTFLFNMSIMDNIRMGNPNASDEQVIQAAKQAGCYDFIANLSNGFYTNAGVAGNQLSGGEKQRIAIVRAMLKDAPVMIMDEATASSDPENEAAIQVALSALAKNKTIIIVAHKLSTIVDADQIALVKNGSIETIGTHEELLNRCKDYIKMWKQFSKPEEGDIL